MNHTRKKIYTVIFESNTKWGKMFDLVLLAVILLSIVTVMVESIPKYREVIPGVFFTIEMIFTGIFTVEYILRIYSAPNRKAYIFSFYGIIDLLSVIPVYLSFFIAGAQSFIIIRAFRLLRVFRILKISRYSNAGNLLVDAIRSSKERIGVFLFAIVTVVIFIGATMYLIEGEKNGFVSIPKSIYWAIVTLTTVGYGDITPQTAVGQFFSGLLMIIGYAIIAVPTGLISVEVAKANFLDGQQKNKTCSACQNASNDQDALYCKKCGSIL